MSKICQKKSKSKGYKSYIELLLYFHHNSKHNHLPSSSWCQSLPWVSCWPHVPLSVSSHTCSWCRGSPDQHPPQSAFWSPHTPGFADEPHHEPGNNINDSSSHASHSSCSFFSYMFKMLRISKLALNISTWLFLARMNQYDKNILMTFVNKRIIKQYIQLLIKFHLFSHAFYFW